MAAPRLSDPSFLNGKIFTRSFKDASHGVSFSSSNFSDLKITSLHGLPALWISEEEVLALVGPLEFALECGFQLMGTSDHRRFIRDVAVDLQPRLSHCIFDLFYVFSYL
ncbi:hypothetical protein KFK09_013338 [Dendrobium nobile]|uniref:Uncharacterized protein n=1 Tax=Dendrobium nobile TaxID=94219 RepID=A0A8T3B9V2_DENNO|nr:hypothetical protein KFK09_013338 [Dendrobium nobile]